MRRLLDPVALNRALTNDATSSFNNEKLAHIFELRASKFGNIGKLNSGFVESFVDLIKKIVEVKREVSIPSSTSARLRLFEAVKLKIKCFGTREPCQVYAVSAME